MSTRRAPRCGDLSSSANCVDYWRLQNESRWVDAGKDAFLHGEDRTLPTILFVHGNRTDADAAVQESWQLYCQVQRQAAGHAFRLVIWSWPSDRIAASPRCDAQVKADYSDVQGFYLADTLGRLEPQTPVSLIGFSFGARVITGALQILAGGEVAGRSLPERHAAEHKPYRSVLLAAALDADWLLPGHRNGLALSQVEQMLVTRNACDRVLNWYGRLYGRGGPDALGLDGPPACERADKIELVDVACSVGRVHDWTLYASACEVLSRLPRYAFLTAP